MSVSFKGRTELQIPKKWKDREASPERTKVWTEPNNMPNVERRVVPVIYYLCRDGQLQHPHFMEVPLSYPQGLYLRDVINRLNFLRGKGIASLYSWSSKRSYKNGFVWHDLAENDYIYPSHGQEHILKGSELLESPSNPNKSHESDASTSDDRPETNRSVEDCDFPALVRRRNQSWSSSGFNEYKVYKADSFGREFAGKAADASTQTDDKRRRKRSAIRQKDVEEKEVYENQSTELTREEISSPPSDSSPETLESLMKADGTVLRRLMEAHEENLNLTARNLHSGRFRPSAVLMQLISCGSMSFRNCGVVPALKDHHHHQGPLIISDENNDDDKSGSTRGVNMAEKEDLGSMIMETCGVKLENREYFSGSLIETKKEEVFTALKRSSSYNTDRASQLEVEEIEGHGVRAKCLPTRKPKTPLVTKKKESNADVSCNNTQLGRSRRSLLVEIHK